MNNVSKKQAREFLGRLCGDQQLFSLKSVMIFTKYNESVENFTGPILLQSFFTVYKKCMQFVFPYHHHVTNYTLLVSWLEKIRSESFPYSPHT